MIVIKIKGLDKLDEKLENTLVDDSNINKALYVSAKKFINETRLALHRGPATGRTRSDGTKSSAPGEPPMSDTGNLARSITIEETNKKHVSVVVKANYALSLEFGAINMEPRPFIRPTFKKMKEKLANDFAEYLFNRIKNA